MFVTSALGKTETGRLGIQGDPKLCRELVTSLVYMNPCLKQNRKRQRRNQRGQAHVKPEAVADNWDPSTREAEAQESSWFMASLGYRVRLCL